MKNITTLHTPSLRQYLKIKLAQLPLLAIAAFSLFSTSATAVRPSPPSIPITYTIDPTHTFASFEYSHLGYSTQRSRFNKTSGNIQLDMETQRGSAQISIDVNSVDSGSSTFDEHLRGSDFFNAKKFPNISFTSNNFHFADGVPSEVMGDLTIKGITKPVTLKITQFKCMMHPMLKKPACGANAIATIQRSEFDNGKYTPYVSDAVNLYIAIEAIAENAPSTNAQ